MNFKQSHFARLAAGGGLLLLASCGKSTGPDATMNAARIPNADLAGAVQFSKISATPFVQKAVAVMRENGAAEWLEKISTILADEKFSAEGVDALAFTMNAAKHFEDMKTGYETPEYLVAARLKKPLKVEAFKRMLAGASEVAGDGEWFVFHEKTAFGKDGDTIVSLAGKDRVVLAGREYCVNDAQERAMLGKRADTLPAMQSLLDAELIKRDAWLVFVPPQKDRADLLKPFLTAKNFAKANMDFVVSQMLGVTAGVDVADKAVVTLNFVFSTPATASDFCDGVSSALEDFANSEMPFLKTAKAVAADKVASLTFDITGEDIEQFAAVAQKARLEKIERAKNQSLDTQDRIYAIERAIQMHEMRTGSFPKAVNELTVAIGNRRPLLSKEALVDAWGTPFQIKLRGENYEVRSAGPDGIFNTGDDLTNKDQQ